MIIWPSTLPEPLTAVQDTTDYGLLRTKMEDGSIRQRRRHIEPRRSLTMQFLLTPTQRRQLDEFAYSKGLDWFVVPAQLSDESTVQVVRIAKSYKAKRQTAISCHVALTADVHTLSYFLASLDYFINRLGKIL